MAHKTFISYKYSESRWLRDDIIAALGDDAIYYKGENVDSRDMTDDKEETIKKALADMMCDTSVTIVILSPNMTMSNWIEWEVQYCLKKITRKNRISKRNGLVGVIKKVNGNYSWLKYITSDGGVSYHTKRLPEIINKNRYNSNPPIKSGNGLWDYLDGSYIAFVEEEVFLNNPQKFIDNAYDKSENDAIGYNLTVTVDKNN